jgi:hypothetical protein
MISNLRLDGHHRETLAALQDRVQVFNYEPSDEQMLALINHIAREGVAGIPHDECLRVANFLEEECRLREIRPSVRLFVDKALRDYCQWKAEQSETDWRDLVVSSLEQQLVDIQHPQRDLTRAEQIGAERRIALDIRQSYSTRTERLEQWRIVTAERFGQAKSPAAFYRRLAEGKTGQPHSEEAALENRKGGRSPRRKSHQIGVLQEHGS